MSQGVTLHNKLCHLALGVSSVLCPEVSYDVIWYHSNTA
jgi:hypothetical protein